MSYALRLITLLALTQLDQTEGLHTRKSIATLTSWQNASENTPMGETCSALTNHGTHSTVQVAVGTPAQMFDIVADTGSNNVIIPSCVCEQNGKCHNPVCFKGSEKSSSFHVDRRGNELPQVVLSFGSGDISAVVSTDVVRVGKQQARMKDGLLLMVDNNLQFSIEGILGLGPPIKAETDDDPSSRSFLAYAGVTKFSMCFNDNADGVLRLNTQLDDQRLGSVGKEHWGLGFEGISVGNVNMPSLFCHKSDMTGEQTTPCGAIPDSGTTAITGPAEALATLLISICDNWGRCRRVAAKNPDVPKYAVLQQLLMACEDWLDESKGLAELPDLYFHVTGAGGNRKSLVLSADSYVMRVDASELQSFTRRVGLSDTSKASLLMFTGEQQKVCLPGFSEMEYNTVQNGPVFILGTAFFYKYQVAYDLGSQPAAMSFKEGACGVCDKDTSFVSTNDKVTSSFRNARPREIHGPERMPTIDTSRPL